MAKSAAAEAESTQGVLDADGEGFTFDMSSQEADSGFPIHPAGVYDFSIDALTYKISQSSGNPMWEVKCLITGPGQEVADKKVQVRSYQVFKPEQMGRVKLFLQRIGRQDLADSPTFNPKKIADDGELVGATGRVRLGVRKSDEYGDQNEVKAFLPAGAGGDAGGGGFSM